ncbi:4'-phosphopantetheinyl transferase superfamily protein [uncultured Brachyspira sp.]|uniref:4'-phosphopantetheinyl transferase family protein n=1 Tax=uncultured Brachyspira sp. TaxID=221953 RepID=UPI0026178BD0|nr:4'-phosphopantetheinyl transferase superfamily protein [uncultured Brachyspira sp.]
MIYLKYVFNNEYNGNIESLSKEMAYKHYNKNNLTIKRNDNGKPYFENEDNIFFNGSHSNDLICVGMSDRLIGVDAEFIKERKFFDIASEYFSFKERKFLKTSKKLEIDFFTLWTLKEAYIKKLGKVIFDIKDSIEIDLDERVIYNADNLFFATFILDDSYIISLCSDIKDKDVIITTDDFNLNMLFAYPILPQIDISI